MLCQQSCPQIRILPEKDPPVRPRSYLIQWSEPARQSNAANGQTAVGRRPRTFDRLPATITRHTQRGDVQRSDAQTPNATSKPPRRAAWQAASGISGIVELNFCAEFQKLSNVLEPVNLSIARNENVTPTHPPARPTPLHTPLTLTSKRTRTPTPCHHTPPIPPYFGITFSQMSSKVPTELANALVDGDDAVSFGLSVPEDLEDRCQSEEIMFTCLCFVLGVAYLNDPLARCD